MKPADLQIQPLARTAIAVAKVEPVSVQSTRSSRRALLSTLGVSLAGAICLRTFRQPSTRPGRLTLSVAEKDIVMMAVRGGGARYFSVDLYDTYDEDGDVVSVSAGGSIESVEVTLTNRGRTLLAADSGGGSAVIRVVALRDGTGIGKVSFGARTSAGAVTSRVLAEGETQEPFLQLRRSHA